MQSSSGDASHAAMLRLMSDLKAVQDEGMNAGPIDDKNMFLWQATLFGPYETAWEGGIFNLTLKFSPDYPQKPPKVRFTSPIYHPNGTLCSLFLPFRSLSFAFFFSPLCFSFSFLNMYLMWYFFRLTHIVYSDGSLCLDIIQNKWTPIYDVAAVLTSITSLLSDPNPDSPANVCISFQSSAFLRAVFFFFCFTC
ncbi:E2 ubiquitin-conjugating enzyme, variant 2 [Balamuthia mandrillaris]